jgi:hypothetical protein
LIEKKQTEHKKSCQLSVISFGLIGKKQTGGQLQSACFPTHRKVRDGHPVSSAAGMQNWWFD